MLLPTLSQNIEEGIELFRCLKLAVRDLQILRGQMSAVEMPHEVAGTENEFVLKSAHAPC